MENLKVYVKNEHERKEIKEILIALEYNFVNNIACEKGYIVASQSSSGVNFDYLADVKEITLQYLRDLVVLKRNDVGDATHEANGYKFYVSEDSVFEYIGGWKDASEYIEDFNLNTIEKKEMKEFLEPSNNYSLIKAHRKEGNDWIEVPNGAEILYFGKKYKSVNHFFKTVNGNSYYKYLEDGSKWMEYSNKGLHDFKENIDKFSIVWQRNTTTPNTSTQDKLKFIEKWLNGEKIQYILGIETEKTQTDESKVDKSKWHNFTEGAMQYIKRPNIKFREAPKYVTINGIEFKSVKSLLKHVKDNFDLEYGE